jgi:hypothetical protein
MANWVHRINLKQAWAKADEDENFRALSKVVIDKLKMIDFGPDYNYDRDEIINEFQYLIDDEESNINDFNSLWNTFYDFADTPLDNKWNGKKLLWVEI